MRDVCVAAGGCSAHDQLVSVDVRLEAEELGQVRLPGAFTIYEYCCGQQFRVEARCTADGGVWSSTELVTALNATQRKEETRAEFNARLKWLRSAAV